MRENSQKQQNEHIDSYIKKPIMSHIFPNKEFMRYRKYVFIYLREQNRQKGKGVSAC